MKYLKKLFLLLILTNFTNCQALLDGEFYISFNVSGLDGALGLELYEGSSLVDTLTVTENGQGFFEESVKIFDQFSIAISSQPNDQTCSIVYSSGTTLGSADETEIYCSSETNTITAIVTGLSEGDTFMIDVNGLEELELTNGENVFETALAQNTPYGVNFEQLPSDKRCTVAGDTSGRISGEDITITYDCSLVNLFFVGGSSSANIGGRSGADEICTNQAEEYADIGWMSCSGDIMAFLSVDADDEIRDIPTNYDINTDLVFHHLHPTLNLKMADNWDDLLDGSIDRSTPASFWSSSNNDGSLSGDACNGWTEVNSDSVKVGGFNPDENWIAGAGNCINESRHVYCICAQTAEELEEEEEEESEEEESEPSDTYTLGGTIEGLVGSITLSLNEAAQTLIIEEDGNFTFETALDDGSDYTVAISSFPEGQTCNLTNASGSLSANVTNISIQCELNRSYFYLSSNTVNANFGGREEADAICEETYDDLDLDQFCLGGIRAFITVDADDEIAGMPENYDVEESDPIYNAQTDLIIADDWEDLLDGSIQNPITADWWSGSLDDGTDSLETCNGWTERSDELVFHGTANQTDSFWIFNSELDCNDAAKILCLCYQ
jgi:hypothetical protein